MRKQIASICALTFKLGPKLLSLLAKFGKFVFSTKMGLAAASVASWSLIFTWQFALIIVGSLFFHEFGHLWAMKLRGIKTKTRT